MKVRNILLGATLMITAASAMAAETYKEAWTKGIKEYKTKKYKESIVTLAEAVTLAKTPGEKYNSLAYYGHALRCLRKYTEAAKAFEDLMKVEKLSAEQKNNAFSQYINNIYYSKKYKEVIDIAEKTIADEKASTSMKTNAAYLATRSSHNLRKQDDKIKWAKKLQELTSKGLLYNRGLIYQAQALGVQKKYNEAEELLTKEVIAKMHPHRQIDAFMTRGQIKAARGKHGEAVLEFIAVYELPKGLPSHKEVAIVHIIDKLNAAGQLEEADVWIAKVDTIKNKYWKTRGLLRTAQNLEKKGKLAEAKTKWEECKKSGPWWKKNADKQIAAINKKLKAK